jgi:hypothetical protein
MATIDRRKFFDNGGRPVMPNKPRKAATGPLRKAMKQIFGV